MTKLPILVERLHFALFGLSTCAVLAFPAGQLFGLSFLDTRVAARAIIFFVVAADVFLFVTVGVFLLIASLYPRETRVLRGRLLKLVLLAILAFFLHVGVVLATVYYEPWFRR